MWDFGTTQYWEEYSLWSNSMSFKLDFASMVRVSSAYNSFNEKYTMWIYLSTSLSVCPHVSLNKQVSKREVESSKLQRKAHDEKEKYYK